MVDMDIKDINSQLVEVAKDCIYVALQNKHSEQLLNTIDDLSRLTALGITPTNLERFYVILKDNNTNLERYSAVMLADWVALLSEGVDNYSAMLKFEDGARVLCDELVSNNADKCATQLIIYYAMQKSGIIDSIDKK